MTKVSNATKKISNGAENLAKGINTLNNNGIKALTSYSSKIKVYSNKAEALIDLSNNYKGFASNNSNETIFITKIKSEKGNG